MTARAVARPFTYEVEEGVGPGAIVTMPFGRRRARGVVVALEDSPPEGVVAVPIDRVVGQVPPALAQSPRALDRGVLRLDARARTRAGRAGAPEAAQGAGSAGRAAVVRRRGRAPRAPAGAAGGDRPDRLRDRCRLRRRLPALRADRLGEDRGLPPGLRGGARAGTRHDPARAGDLAGAADGRTGSRPVRRPGRDPALGADRSGAARRAPSDRER